MIEINSKGPVFDGRAQRALEDYREEVVRVVGVESGEDVVRTLNQVLQQPTGHYVSHVHTMHKGLVSETAVVGVIYDKWIEGTGSRNRKTRFKGYHTFRKVTERMIQKWPSFATRILPSYLRRMRG